MRTIYLYILIQFGGLNSLVAECGGSGVIIWPQTKNLFPNSILVIEGYGSSQDLLFNIGKSYHAYLTSPDATIELQPVKILKGQFSVTQLFLQPKTPLIPESKYTLRLLNANKKEVIVQGLEGKEWEIISATDKKIPVFITAPEYTGYTFTPFGCGPAVYYQFCVCIKDESPTLIYTRVKEEKSGKIMEYYLTPSSGILKVGHGMCHGAFCFNEEETYEFSFSLMDAAGNTNPHLTSPVQVGQSTPKNNNYPLKPACNCEQSKENKKGSVSILGFIISCIVGMIFISITVFFKKKK